MSCRICLWCTALLVLSCSPVVAQPPSALELVQGIRQAGMPDLALEYLREIEADPAKLATLSELDRQAIPLVRAKCLLDSIDEEPDEGTRISISGEAKEAFNAFLVSNPQHPQAWEASLSLARLTSLEARAQLNRAMRIEPGDDDDELRKKRDVEALKARPLFLLASKRFSAAAQLIKAKLTDKSLSAATRQAIARDAFDADLAAAINQVQLADTFLGSEPESVIERSKFLDDARATLAKLATGAPTNRTVWLARAWMAESLAMQQKPNEAEAESKLILASNLLEAEEGKRLVRFFQVRRQYLNALRDTSRLSQSERELRNWLNRYGKTNKLTPEVISARYYLALTLQEAAFQAIGPEPKDGKLPTLSNSVRKQLEEAEKLYRALSQTDNDYTTRANRNRMAVVRKLMGEADRPAAEYVTFETAQIAALIQIAKLGDAQQRYQQAMSNPEEAEAGFWASWVGSARRTQLEIQHRKEQVLELLERARGLATDKDPPGDVIDTLLRLVYFYQSNDEPYKAAVLGEHLAQTIKATGGKASTAGMLALNAYTTAANRIKPDTSDPSRAELAIAAAAEARQSDRNRAIQMARYLDTKFPYDIPTDSARHRLAIMLLEDGKLASAFEALMRIRAGYPSLTNARLLEGYIASQLVTSLAKDIPLPAGMKREEVFRRAIKDLSLVSAPAATAAIDEIRSYLSARARLGLLFLAQSRADEAAEQAGPPGYDKALATANEIVAQIPTFDSLLEKPGEAKNFNLDGREMNLLAQDLRARALYLRSRNLLDGTPEQLAAAAEALGPAIEDVQKTGALVTAELKQWAGGQGDEGDSDELAAQKARVAGLASGVDRTRRDIVMLGFKLRVKQGKPEEAAVMLDLLEKAGGSVEANQSTLELMARELAAQIPGLRQEGKTNPAKETEAKALGDGLAILLKRLVDVPKLTPASILFLGQTLHTVGQDEDAIKQFLKIATPSQADWATRKLEDFPQEIRNQLRNEIRDYRLAQLYLAQSQRGAGKLAESEKLVLAAIGTPEERGWAYNSLDFRKEMAMIYEAKGAAKLGVPKDEWGKALKEWSTLFQVAQNQVSELTPDTPQEQVRLAKSNFFDAYLDIQRCLLEANSQLLMGNPKLAETFTSIGKRIADMERTNRIDELEQKNQGILSPEVWIRYSEILEKYPDLLNAYKAAGGKFFLDRPKR